MKTERASEKLPTTYYVAPIKNKNKTKQNKKQRSNSDQTSTKQKSPQVFLAVATSHSHPHPRLADQGFVFHWPGFRFVSPLPVMSLQLALVACFLSDSFSAKMCVQSTLVVGLLLGRKKVVTVVRF